MRYRHGEGQVIYTFKGLPQTLSCVKMDSNHRPLGLGIRRHPRQVLCQLSYSRMEQVIGIEPTFPEWKSGALTVVLYPHAPEFLLNLLDSPTVVGSLSFGRLLI